MKWEVEYTDQFEDWWETLLPEEQEAIDAAVELLEDRGPALGRPLADNVHQSRHANMKELRPTTTIRVLFAFDPRRVAILLIGGDKARSWNRWYNQFVPMADGLYDDHLDEIERTSERREMRMAKPYSKLRDEVRKSPDRAERVAVQRQAMEDALALAEIREKRELTQNDLARVLSTSQANVSRIERQRDLYLSTLAQYVAALGGTLKISAVFDDEEVEIGAGPRLAGRR